MLFEVNEGGIEGRVDALKRNLGIFSLIRFLVWSSIIEREGRLEFYILISSEIFWMKKKRKM